MSIAELADRRLHYVRRGRGDVPLLLVQGMTGHHLTWGEPLLALLDEHFDVLTYDHRGIGDSSRVDQPFTTADMADDAAGLMDAVGWRDAHVLGVSMGGMVAQEFALRHRDRVRTLGLGCTYAGPDGGSLDGPGLIRMQKAMGTRDVDVLTRAGFEANLSPGFQTEEGYQRFRENSLAVKVPAPVVLLQAQAAGAHDAVSRLPELDVPTLVVHGTADEVVPVGNGKHIASLIPGARLELLDGVGHMFWWERPERTAELLRELAG